MLAKMKTYNFWIKITSAVLLLARIIGSKFGFEIDSVLFMDIVTAVAGILVVMGIISAPTVVTTKEVGKILENTYLENAVANTINQNGLESEISHEEMDENKHVVDENTKIESSDSEEEISKTQVNKESKSDLETSENIEQKQDIIIKRYVYKSDGSLEEITTPNDKQSISAEDSAKYYAIETIEIPPLNESEEAVQLANEGVSVGEDKVGVEVSYEASGHECAINELSNEVSEQNEKVSVADENVQSVENLDSVGVAEEVMPSHKNEQNETQTQGVQETAKVEATQDNARQSALVGQVDNVNSDAVVGILDRLSLLIEKLENL